MSEVLKPVKPCTVEGCSRPSHKGNRFCSLHEQRFTAHGDPNVVKTRGVPPGTTFPLVAGNFPCTCGGKTTVKDSRPMTGGIRRRRSCLACRERFTTVEVRAEEVDKAIALVDASRKSSIINRMQGLESVLGQLLDELQTLRTEGE